MKYHLKRWFDNPTLFGKCPIIIIFIFLGFPLFQNQAQIHSRIQLIERQGARYFDSEITYESSLYYNLLISIQLANKAKFGWTFVEIFQQ